MNLRFEIRCQFLLLYVNFDRCSEGSNFEDEHTHGKKEYKSVERRKARCQLHSEAEFFGIK